MASGTIQNLIVTAYLNCGFNLNVLLRQFPHAQYNASRFSALRLHFDEPIKTTLLIFKTGCIVCTGTKTLDDAKAAVSHFCHLIGDGVKVVEIRIRNVVASYNSGRPLNIEALYYAYRRQCVYEPEFFPALKLLMHKPTQLVVLIFHSGKMIFTGSQSIHLTQRAVTRVIQMLQTFYRQ